MNKQKDINVAIVDYGLGNLFSVKHACRSVGMNAIITPSRDEIDSADAIFLPGVGAYGDAIAALKRLDLIDFLREQASKGKPLIGICLGFQLLMSEGEEFGRHEGLGIIDGKVIHFKNPMDEARVLKVPQVGWNTISRAGSRNSNAEDPWKDTPLDGIEENEFMYFVHSYYVMPSDTSVALSSSRYGDIEFCSSILSRNIFASQFHPERSGPKGLQMYRNIASWILSQSNEKGEVL